LPNSATAASYTALIPEVNIDERDIGRHLNASPDPLSDRRRELAVLDSVMQRALAKDPVNASTVVLILRPKFALA